MVDPRQVVAGFLTLSMFVMLGNMIKHDHFTSVSEVISGRVPPLSSSPKISHPSSLGLVYWGDHFRRKFAGVMPLCSWSLILVTSDLILHCRVLDGTNDFASVD
jgi:hypothetical protein